jgi:N6-L-threonylcarbamoyladenine synthase
MAPAAAVASEQLAPVLRISLQDVEATETFGATLAHMAQRGDVFFLKGELGVGKTSFARGFLREFFGNPTLDVPSPSYLLQFSYSDTLPAQSTADQSAQNGDSAGASPEGGAEVKKAPGHTFHVASKSLLPGCSVYHIDPYRLPEGKIAALLDFEEVFAAVALIEWPERLGPQLTSADTPPRLEVQFEGFGPQAQGRSVVLTGIGKRWRELVESWTVSGGPLCRPAEAPPESSVTEVQISSMPTLADTDSAAAMEKRRPAGLGVRELDSDPSCWRVLGIESSCDDTGAAILDGNGNILGEALASQAGIHEAWGGVVPRLAQEAHRGAIDATVEEALQLAGLKADDITAVAVTVGPGLGLCLEVGVRKALQIAAKHRLPLVRIHHMEAHAMVARLPPLPAQVQAGNTPPPPVFPFLTLLVSGGHNLAVLTHGLGHHRILGSTIDDSIGEAFDKTARILGITQIPGGPHLERLAKEGDVDVYDTSLPRPLSKTRDPVLQKGCDFSFSGLKTAVRSLVEKELSDAKVSDMAEADLKQTRANVAAAFQHVAVEHLCQRAQRAADWARELAPELKWLIVAGGVAANQTVRSGLRSLAESSGLEMRCPPPRLCVDNGVMVAWAGIERLRLGLYEVPPSETGVDHAVEIRPRWPLGERDARSQPKGLPKGQKRKFKGSAGGEAAAKAVKA